MDLIVGLKYLEGYAVGQYYQHHYNSTIFIVLNIYKSLNETFMLFIVYSSII